MPEIILIVDDEDSVRRTFSDWLRAGGFPCEVHSVGDAESALRLANEKPIDLAILDWNLGTGADGLKLLQDLVEFHPDVVAILVTGYAHQATPLDALRMGVRDYLDKNQDLNRETFLNAVRRQLQRIIPAKRQRLFNQNLAAFRQAVEKVLPLIQSSAALNDPLPLPDAVQSLFRFLLRTTRAESGVMVLRKLSESQSETIQFMDSDGRVISGTPVPFARSLAAVVVSLQEPSVINLFDAASLGAVELNSFEQNRRNMIAAPMSVAAGAHVVLELFDSPNGFDDNDRRLVAAGAELGAQILRQALAERQTHHVLFDAVETALRATSQLADQPLPDIGTAPDTPPTPEVMEQLRQGLTRDGSAVVDAESSLRLAEVVRVLAMRHGPAAVQHCIRVAESLRETLDEITGMGTD